MSLRDLIRENAALAGYRAGVRFAVNTVRAGAVALERRGEIAAAAAWREAARVVEMLTDKQTDEQRRAKLRGDP